MYEGSLFLTISQLQFTIYFSYIIQSKESKLAVHIKYHKETTQHSFYIQYAYNDISAHLNM